MADQDSNIETTANAAEETEARAPEETAAPVVHETTLAKRLATQTDPKTKLNLLRIERIDWERTELRAADQRRNEILTETYRLRLAFTRDELAAMVKDAKLSMNDATSAAALAVKLVFNDGDRRRASKFGKVLTVAETESVEPDELINWINKKGGIEEIRRAPADGTVTGKDAVELGKRLATAKTSPDFSISAKQTADVKTGEDKFVVLLSRRNESSGLDVLYSLSADAVLNAVFKEIAKLEDRAVSKKAQAPRQERATKEVAVSSVTSAGFVGKTEAIKAAVEATNEG